MHWRERSIRERFEQQTCTQCGAPYPPSSVVVVAHRGGVYILLASCDRCEHRALFRVSFLHRSPDTTLPEPVITPAPSSPTSPATSSSAIASTGTSSHARTAITTADVEAMERFLSTFDGNFQRLFGE
jgi:hypothetical protein